MTADAAEYLVALEALVAAVVTMATRGIGRLLVVEVVVVVEVGKDLLVALGLGLGLEALATDLLTDGLGALLSLEGRSEEERNEGVRGVGVAIVYYLGDAPLPHTLPPRSEHRRLWHRRRPLVDLRDPELPPRSHVSRAVGKRASLEWLHCDLGRGCGGGVGESGRGGVEGGVNGGIGKVGVSGRSEDEGQGGGGGLFLDGVATAGEVDLPLLGDADEPLGKGLAGGVHSLLGGVEVPHDVGGGEGGGGGLEEGRGIVETDLGGGVGEGGGGRGEGGGLLLGLW